MPHSIIEQFYTAFQRQDAKTMGSLYADHATFQDPGFGLLSAKEVIAMWKMLVKSGGSDLKIAFEIIKENERSGEAIWKADYVFGKDRRPIHNVIHSKFEFDNGKIAKQVDRFNFWKWTRMALGTTGLLLGWSPLLKNKVRIQALRRLTKFRQENEDV